MSAARRLLFILAAALAVLALAFTGTAAAEKEATVACPEAPITGDECEGEAFEAGTAITASSEEIVFTVEDVVPLFGIDGVVECESALAGEPVEDTVEPPLLTGKLSTLSFTSCEEVLTSSPCTVTTVGLPYETQLEHELSTPGDGELFAYKGSEGSRPGATVFCEAPVTVNCTYLVDENASEIGGGTTDLARFDVDGSSEPKIIADEVKFEESSGTCPGHDPEMDGEWEVSAPAALFVAQKKWDFEVKPDPIPIAKVNDTVSVEVKNTGKTDWTLIVMGVPMDELFLDAKDCVDKDKQLVKVKAGSKCTPTLKCLKKGESQFLISLKLPWKSIADFFTATKCEVK